MQCQRICVVSLMKEREREREKEKTTKNFETNDQFIFRFSHKSYKKTQKKKKEHKQTKKKYT